MILEKGEFLSSVAELYWEPIFCILRFLCDFDRFSTDLTDFQPINRFSI